MNDPGLTALLRATGATLTWRPGERYVLVTTSAPAVVTFAIGDRRYDVGSDRAAGEFCPLRARRRGVSSAHRSACGRSIVALRQDGRSAVLQPQLSTLDVRRASADVTFIVHGGAPLRPRVTQSASSVIYAFDGVGTTLAGTRAIGSAAFAP